MAGRPRVRHLLHAAALAVGAIAFAVLLDQVGWAGLRRAVVATGTWFAVIAAIDHPVLGGCLHEEVTMTVEITPGPALPGLDLSVVPLL